MPLLCARPWPPPVQRCREQGYASILMPEPALARLPGGGERLVEESVCAALLALYRFTALKKPGRTSRLIRNGWLWVLTANPFPTARMPRPQGRTRG